MFREELKLMKEKSTDKQQGMFVQAQNVVNNNLFMSRQRNELVNFEFDLLQKHIAWRKINPKVLIKTKFQLNNNNNEKKKRAINTTDVRFSNSNASFSIMTPVTLLPIGSLL